MNACRVLNKAIFECYRQLGFAISITLAYLLALLPVVTAGPATVALCDVLMRRMGGEEAGVRAFLSSMKRHARTGIALLMLQLIVYLPAAVYLIVLGNHSFGWIGNILSWLVLYVILMASLVQLYLYPLVALQSITKLEQLPQAIYQAYQLAGRHPLHSTLLLILLGVAVSFSVIIPILFLTVGPVLVGYALCCNLNLLLARYEPTRFQSDLHADWRSIWKPWRTQ
ncbi:MAG: DUF624 domain-containing protein [Tumebacillaceae bacterium]